jgi:hypothetical protein
MAIASLEHTREGRPGGVEHAHEVHLTILRQAAGSASAIGAGSMTPATFTSTFTPPKASSARRTIASAWA